MHPEDNRQDDWNSLFSIADWRLPRRGGPIADIRNSQKPPPRPSGVEFRFSAPTIGNQQSAIKNWPLLAAVPRCHYYYVEE